MEVRQKLKKEVGTAVILTYGRLRYRVTLYQTLILRWLPTTYLERMGVGRWGHHLSPMHAHYRQSGPVFCIPEKAGIVGSHGARMHVTGSAVTATLFVIYGEIDGRTRNLIWTFLILQVLEEDPDRSFLISVFCRWTDRIFHKPRYLLDLILIPDTYTSLIPQSWIHIRYWEPEAH